MEKIDWKQELLDSQRFNKKEEKLLKEGAKSLTDSWYLGALYMRYKRLKGIKDDIKENKGQLQTSFREFENKIKKD
tara:strand:+ start:662 stop:889 length:228 start_codon:yes stop_codon:yes gene_type:complete